MHRARRSAPPGWNPLDTLIDCRTAPVVNQVDAPRHRSETSEEGTTVTYAPDMPVTPRTEAAGIVRQPRRPLAGGDADNVVIRFPLPAPVAGKAGGPTAHRAAVPSVVRPGSTPRVSVVVPTYNEAKNLPGIMNRIPAEYEVVVVDGRSVDNTVEVARALRPDATIVMQNRRGKGNAMACGFAAVTGDIVVMLDADGSAAPEEISRFVDALLAGADFAKGSRFAPGGGSTDITRVRAWGNRWLNRIANLLFRTEYTDLCYGYNAFWRYCLADLELDPRHGQRGEKLWGDGFEIETIINTRMAKAGMRITEVPSFEFPRVHGMSNLNTWRDGSRVLWALMVERVNGVGRRHGSTVSRPPRFAGNPATDPGQLLTGEMQSA